MKTASVDKLWIPFLSKFSNNSTFLTLDLMTKGLLSSEHHNKQILKLVSVIFYQIFIFLPNDSPSKTVKNVFCFIKKVFLFSRDLNFCAFLPSFQHFRGLKGQMEKEEFLMSWTDLHKFVDVIFGIIQIALYCIIKISKMIHN